MKEHQATVQKLVKQCAKASMEWNCYIIKRIEANIENYDKGMKMLVKLSKNLNATLYSDIEEKGKGKRMKKQIKHFDNSNKENKPKKRRNEQLMLPPFPQLMNVNKLSHQSLPNKIDKMKKSFMDKASTSKNIQKPISVSHKINVSNEIGEIPENNNYMTHQEVKSVKESFSMEMPKSKSAAITSEENPEEFSLTSTKCSANHQKCAYTSKGKVTLESIAQAICHLNENAQILNKYFKINNKLLVITFC